MDLASTYDPSKVDLNLGEILHGESLVKGAQNLHAVTLYAYPTHFLVSFFIHLVNRLLTSSQA